MKAVVLESYALQEGDMHWEALRPLVGKPQSRGRTKQRSTSGGPAPPALAAAPRPAAGLAAQTRARGA